MTTRARKSADEAEQPICVEIPTKVSDVNKAAEMLGKYYALFTEKLNVDGDMDYSIKIDYGGGDADQQNNSTVSIRYSSLYINARNVTL